MGVKRDKKMDKKKQEEVFMKQFLGNSLIIAIGIVSLMLLFIVVNG